MDDEVIKLSEIMDAIKKRMTLIIAITIGCTLISLILSFFIIKPKYEASTKLFVGKEETIDQNYNNSDVQMYQQLIKTYTEIITTKDLVEKAIRNNNLDIKAEEALGIISVIPKANTQILEIKVTSKDPILARDLTSSVANEFIKEAESLVKNGTVKIVEKARVPEKPISPNKKLNIAIAFLLGLFIGIGLALLLEFLDNTYKTKENLEKDLGLPVLGVIPLGEE